MGKSKATDYMVEFLENRGIPAEWASEVTGVPVEKLKRDYVEPLMADEFLELCAILQVRPEEVIDTIKNS